LNEQAIQNVLEQLNVHLLDALVRLHPTRKTITLFTKIDFNIIAQQQFTSNEWVIFMSLLTSYPHYASHEALFAAVTSLPLEQCRQELRTAQAKGSANFKNTFKSVTRALTGVRRKVSEVVPMVHIRHIQGCGYILMIDNKS
jgi:hypothetical protein